MRQGLCRQSSRAEEVRCARRSPVSSPDCAEGAYNSPTYRTGPARARVGTARCVKGMPCQAMPCQTAQRQTMPCQTLQTSQEPFLGMRVLTVFDDRRSGRRRCAPRWASMQIRGAREKLEILIVLRACPHRHGGCAGALQQGEGQRKGARHVRLCCSCLPTGGFRRPARPTSQPGLLSSKPRGAVQTQGTWRSALFSVPMLIANDPAPVPFADGRRAPPTIGTASCRT